MGDSCLLTVLDSRMTCTHLPIMDKNDLCSKRHLRYGETWVVLMGGPVLKA